MVKGATRIVCVGAAKAVTLATQMIQEVLVSGTGKLLQMADVPSTAAPVSAAPAAYQQPQQAADPYAVAGGNPYGAGPGAGGAEFYRQQQQPAAWSPAGPQGAFDFPYPGAGAPLQQPFYGGAGRPMGGAIPQPVRVDYVVAVFTVFNLDE